MTHRRRFSSIMLVAVLALLGAIVPSTAANAANGSISGVVTVGGVAQAGVSVKLWSAANSYSSKSTNAAGEYSFSVAPGDYRIEFVGALGTSDWQGEWWQERTTSSNATVIPVASGQAVTGIDGELARSDGSISGATDSIVTIGVGSGYVQLEQCTTGIVLSKYVGSSSTFSFAKLPPGDYLLKYRVEGVRGVDSWHTDATTRTTATKVSLDQAEFVTDANITVHTLGTLAGTLKPAEGAWVTIGATYYVMDLAGKVVRSTSTLSGGFTLYGIPAGDYVVYAYPMINEPWAPVYSGNTSEFVSATPVTVTNDGWTDVHLRTRPSTTVSGKVTMNGVGVANANVILVARGVAGAFTEIPQSVTTDANGNYSMPFTGLGPYKLMVFGDEDGFPWPYGNPSMETFEAKYYSNATTLWSASEFTVTPGTTLVRNLTVDPSAGQTAIPEPSVAPSITGAAIGGTLVADPGTWDTSGLAFAYQWRVGGVDVVGANGASFAAAPEHAYRPVTVVVSANKAGHLWRQVESAPVVIEHGDAPGAFADVPSASPFYANIEWMAANGISTGSVNEPGRPLFKPEDSISRMAFAAFLYRYSGVTFTPPTTPTFGDVTSANPFYTAIEWMAAEGITNGNVSNCGKLNFLPEDPISRQAAAAFLSRFAGASVTTPEEQRFADVPVDGTFAAAIDWMGANGISTGNVNPDGGLPLYAPLDPISRQAVAAFLARYDALP